VRDAMRKYRQLNGGRGWRLGVYGSYDVVGDVRSKVAGVDYVWQTHAWSGGRVCDCNIHQYKNDVTFCGMQVDHDRSPGAHGGFRV